MVELPDNQFNYHLTEIGSEISNHSTLETRVERVELLPSTKIILIEGPNPGTFLNALATSGMDDWIVVEIELLKAEPHMDRCLLQRPVIHGNDYFH